MAVSADLKKLLDAIRAHADKDEILTALKDDPEYVDLRNAIYQVAFNDGHKTATDAHAGAKTKAQEKLDAANAAKDAAEAALAKLKKDNPDAAQLHADYGAQITQLKDQIKALEATHLAEKKTVRQKSVRDTLEKELIALRVDPHKAEAMADANQKHISVGDDLSERIIQPGKSTAYAGDIATQVKAFASDLFKTVPKELILSKVPGGGPGDKGSVVGEGGEGGDKRAALAAAKEAALNKFKAGKGGGTNDRPLNPQDEVNRRLGQRTRV